MKALVVDDEARARRILEELLKEYCPQVTEIITAEDVPSAVKAINQYKPVLVFLDIEMPQFNGFQLFDFLHEVNFATIFTTAYSEYAIQAFQVSAIDYLLKPIQVDLLIKAVEKAEKQVENTLPTQQIQTLQENMQSPYIKRLALPVAEGLVFIEVKDIVCLKADGSYTEVVLGKNKRYLVSKNLKSFEDVLVHSFFFRPQKAF
jgi:two-component system LytT family response regulator